MPSPSATTNPRAGAVLAKALLRAAELLSVSDAVLARIVGVSPASVSRLRAATRPVDPQTKEGELAILFLRMYRSLDGLMSGNPDAVNAWFNAENRHLHGIPSELVQTIQGLTHVIEYLDAMRAKT